MNITLPEEELEKLCYPDSPAEVQEQLSQLYHNLIIQGETSYKELHYIRVAIRVFQKLIEETRKVRRANHEPKVPTS